MTAPWLAVVGLGTLGGELLADGDALAPGVHLLWALNDQLGFPLDGYDVWRRRHRPPEWACLGFDEADAPPPGTVSWSWLHYRLTADPGPVEWVEFACGKQPGLSLPGAQTFQVTPPMRVAAARGSGTREAPVVEVLGPAGKVIVRGRARTTTGGGWAFEIWAEGMRAIRLTGEDLSVCLLCFGIPNEDAGWDRLTPRHLLLPVVRPESANSTLNLHGSGATRASAFRRLSDTLPDAVRGRLADDFAEAVRPAVEQMLRDGRDAALPATPDQAGGSRTPPTLGMATASLVALTALDPDVSRMLGLYWHDPIADGEWDYKVVAHHGPAGYPSTITDVAGLDQGPLAEDTLTAGEVTFVGTAGLEVVVAGAPWSGSPALRLASSRVGTEVGLRWSTRVGAVALRVAGAPTSTFRAWRAGHVVDTTPGQVGVVSLAHAGGIDAVTWTGGPVDLVDVERFEEAGPVGDQAAFAWNLSPGRPPPVYGLTVTDLAADTEPTRPAPDGSPSRDVGVVGLSWDAQGPNAVGQPVLVQVARSLRGDGEGPAPQGIFHLRTQGRPAAASVRPAAPHESTWPGPAVPRRWIEREQPTGWSAWRVRAVDAFGRLGEWSPERLVDVRPVRVPPPPTDVTARYVDPADPYLSDADRDLAVDGAGLLVEWTWPAGRRMQAPSVEPAGEFRVYVRRGDPNLLSGTVTAVTPERARSRLHTHLTWRGDSDALAGALLRLAGATFEVFANGSGENTWVEVEHRTAPLQRPGTGPFTVRLAPADRAWTDLTRTHPYDRRAHAEPVGSLPALTSTIVSVSPDGEGAEVGLTDPLGGATDDILPGLLVCAGVAYPVLGPMPAPDTVRVAAVDQPDGAALLPTVGARCTVWTGRRYRAWLPGARLEPQDDEPLALALVAVTTADGDAAVTDDPVWSRPGRGALGERPGLEGPIGGVVRVSVPRRTPPPPVVVVRPPEQDGDIPAVPTDPADWYGRAHVSIAFDPVAGAAGYRVLRVSTAALLDHDRGLRRTTSLPYIDGPFTDGGASLVWLAEHYPDLDVEDLTADPATLEDPAVVESAWRDWAAWYYPSLLNREVMDLADLDTHQVPFLPAHAGTVAVPPFRDTVDGRGLGRFAYRVRTVDASGNVGDWSRTLPLVAVRDTTPPAMPVLSCALGDENAVVITWPVGAEPDLAGYRIWRAATRQVLDDVRRLLPHAEIVAAAGEPTQVWRDENLTALATWFYRVAAVDDAGNVSPPTQVVAARAIDTYPPEPPRWIRAERDSADPAVVHLVWTVAEDGVVCMVERRLPGERIFTASTGWLPPTRGARSFAWQDPVAGPSTEATYRIRARDAAGNEQRMAWNPVTVTAMEGLR